MKQQGGPTFNTKVAQSIAKYGVHIVGVNTNPPFFYTIGRHGLGLPELLLVGPFHHENAFDWLNRIHLILAHRAAVQGETISLGGTFPVRLLNVTKQLSRVQGDYTVQVGEFYRTTEYKIQQVLIPDHQGRLSLLGQPILGEPV